MKKTGRAAWFMVALTLLVCTAGCMSASQTAEKNRQDSVPGLGELGIDMCNKMMAVAGNKQLVDVLRKPQAYYSNYQNAQFHNAEYEFNPSSDGKGIVIYRYIGTEMEKVIIPDTIENMPVVSIAGWQKEVNEVIIPDSVKRIEPLAFYCCGIKKITFGQKPQLEFVGHHAFAYNLLESFDIPRKKMEISETAYFMTPIKKIQIYGLWRFTDGYSYNYFYYFSGMTLPYLEEVTFEEGVTSITGQLFSQSPSLKKIIFPSTLRYIGIQAFYACTSLEEIIIHPATKLEKYQGANIFAHCNLSLQNIQKLSAIGLKRTDMYYRDEDH